jgi:hypothetical protein
MLKYGLILVATLVLFSLIYLVVIVYTRNVFVPRYHKKLSDRDKILPADLGTVGRRAIFYGMVRDGLPGLIKTQKSLCDLARFFEEVKFTILENGSSDGTREFLEKWSSTDERVNIVNGNGEKAQRDVETFLTQLPNSNVYRGPGRIARYVCLRNQLHSSVKEIILEGKFSPTHCIATDLDQYRTIDENGFYSSLKLMDTNQDVTACSAYGRTTSAWKMPFSTYLYDSYAYHDKWLEVNDPDKKCGMKSRHIWNSKIDVTKKPHEVLSNFGGVCIYRPSEQFLNNYYAVENINQEQGLCDCEHVGFHRRLTKNSASKLLITFESFFSE